MMISIIQLNPNLTTAETTANNSTAIVLLLGKYLALSHLLAQV
jgi:hypothetical protein